MCKKYTLKELIDDRYEDKQEEAFEELKLRMTDAATFNHIKMEGGDLEASFMLPQL